MAKVNMMQLREDPTQKVITHNICPPIPVRSADWVAYYDGEEEDGPSGYGATEQQAIAALIDNTDIEDLVNRFDITVFEADTHRGPEHGHWVAYCRNSVVSAPWRDQAVADLAAKLIKAA